MRSIRALGGAMAVFATLAVCLAAGLAQAAGRPQITAAGIDASDRMLVTWRLAPGTTFGLVTFSSVPIPHPTLPATFAGDNAVAFSCARPPRSCTGTPTQTAYRSSTRVSRDRRYFVKVSARGRTRRPLTSQVWVIDETRPLIAGRRRAPATPTNLPVLGRPFVAPRLAAIATPRLSLQTSPPQAIATVVRRGVRASVSCPVAACYILVRLEVGGATLVFSDATLGPGGRGTFVLRPRPRRRGKLLRLRRARLQIRADVIQPGGMRTRLARRISVRR